jgi:RNA polymerase sigma-70 factor (ECF subfamily)
MDRARSGDAQAFAELWRDAHPMVLRYLRVIAGDSAEDVASQTWITVIQSLATFTGDEPGFRRWLATVARTTNLDRVRWARRRPERLLADVIDLAERTGRPAPDAAVEAEEHFSTDRAIRLVACLPPDQAEMVMLRVVMGLDVADVAAVVGRSPGAVRVAVHRALRRLGELLAAGEPAVTQDEPMAFPVRDA